MTTTNNQFDYLKLKAGEGEEQPPEVPKTYSQEDLDTAIAAAVAKSSDDSARKLKAKNDELLSDIKSLKENAKKYEGIDIEKTKALYAAMENDQDLKDIAEGKHEEVISRRMERERAKFTSDVERLTEERDLFKNQSTTLNERVTNLIIDNSVVSEFVKEGGVESAIDDVRFRARSVWKLENDDPIPRGADGEIITGGDGPMNFNEWVVNLKKSAPHLFKPSTGAGVSNSSGGEALSTIEAQIKEAISSGNHEEYRRLRKKQKEGK